MYWYATIPAITETTPIRDDDDATTRRQYYEIYAILANRETER